VPDRVIAEIRSRERDGLIELPKLRGLTAGHAGEGSAGPVARSDWVACCFASARASARAAAAAGGSAAGLSSQGTRSRRGKGGHLAALDRLDVMNAAAIPLRAEPVATRGGEMV